MAKKKKNKGKLINQNNRFSLIHGEAENEFYLYRNDESELNDDEGKIALELYLEYLFLKKMEDEATDLLYKDIFFEISMDRKFIRMTICEKGELPPGVEAIAAK